MGAGGLLGLLAIAVVAGLVSGVAEVLGMFLPGLRLTFAALIFIILLDLGSSDDNLTLPIISKFRRMHTGFLKRLGMADSWLTSS